MGIGCPDMETSVEAEGSGIARANGVVISKGTMANRIFSKEDM